MSTNYTGQTPGEVVQSFGKRFLYGLKRTDEGELWLGKLDQMQPESSLAINIPGDPEDNFDNLEEGQNFFEGRDNNHKKVYENLNYEQFKWDNRNIMYYVDDEGQLVARVNRNFTYDPLSSSDSSENY